MAGRGVFYELRRAGWRRPHEVETDMFSLEDPRDLLYMVRVLVEDLRNTWRASRALVQRAEALRLAVETLAALAAPFEDSTLMPATRDLARGIVQELLEAVRALDEIEELEQKPRDHREPLRIAHRRAVNVFSTFDCLYLPWERAFMAAGQRLALIARTWTLLQAAPDPAARPLRRARMCPPASRGPRAPRGP